jgi:hypothetical protein
MKPRRLSTPWILQRFLYLNQKVAANTCNKLYTRARENGRKREEWEMRDFGIITTLRE